MGMGQGVFGTRGLGPERVNIVFFILEYSVLKYLSSFTRVPEPPGGKYFKSLTGKLSTLQMSENLTPSFHTLFYLLF